MSATRPAVNPVQGAIANGAENWWEFLQRARRELEASGAAFRRGVDIAAEIDQIRGEHERPDAIYWEIEWENHHPEA